MQYGQQHDEEDDDIDDADEGVGEGDGDSDDVIVTSQHGGDEGAEPPRYSYV